MCILLLHSFLLLYACLIAFSCYGEHVLDVCKASGYCRLFNANVEKDNSYINYILFIKRAAGNPGLLVCFMMHFFPPYGFCNVILYPVMRNYEHFIFSPPCSYTYTHMHVIFKDILSLWVNHSGSINQASAALETVPQFPFNKKKIISCSIQCVHFAYFKCDDNFLISCETSWQHT